MTRRLRVSGWFPLILCGAGRISRNWIQTSEEISLQGPIGGNFSLAIWNLKVLYYEYLKKRNRWSHTNANLDLMRYHGCTFKLWRDEEKDYLFSYELNTPMKQNILTAPSAPRPRWAGARGEAVPSEV